VLHHLTPVHASLAALRLVKIEKRTIRLGATVAARRGLGLGGTVCTSHADGNDIDGPRSSGIATSMHDGASNSGCVCLACSTSPAPRTAGSPCQTLRLGSCSEPPVSTARLFGWVCSLLVREEILLADLVWEKNTDPARNLRSFTTSTSQPNRLAWQSTLLILMKEGDCRHACVDGVATEVATLSPGGLGTMPSPAAARHVRSNAWSHYPLRFGLD